MLRELSKQKDALKILILNRFLNLFQRKKNDSVVDRYEEQIYMATLIYINLRYPYKIALSTTLCRY